MPQPAVVTHLTPGDVDAVRQLVDRATAADGVVPLSEHVRLHLPGGGDEGVLHALARDTDGQLLGYGHLDVTDRVAGSSAELVVDPDRRQHGCGRALVETLIARTPDGRLRLWAHGDTPAAARLGHALGFARTRVLLQMRRRLDAPLPQVQMLDGVRVRTFDPDRDRAAWLELNGRAFADHPEQGRWTDRDLTLRLAEPWFDPHGFFLAERGDRLVGFHWTKVHGSDSPEGNGPAKVPGSDSPEGNGPAEVPGSGTPERHGHAPVGEVYVVGVDPAEQGQGLGRALTLVGLHSLRDRGLAEVLLYVDEVNGAAVRTYQRLGFTTSLVDVCYSRG